VSKQDTHFFNVFSFFIGILVVAAILIFALARVVASETQDRYVLEDPAYAKNVQARVKPFARIAIAGKDNKDLVIPPPAGTSQGAGTVAALPKTGEELFQQTCSACHAQGIVGAPKVGDKAAWGPRIAKGKPTLYEHALKGFQGSTGVMPAKGGRTDAPDALVEQAVDYMVSQAK
jgi:cytochrome c5